MALSESLRNQILNNSRATTIPYRGGYAFSYYPAGSEEGAEGPGACLICDDMTRFRVMHEPHYRRKTWLCITCMYNVTAPPRQGRIKW